MEHRPTEDAQAPASSAPPLPAGSPEPIAYVTEKVSAAVEQERAPSITPIFSDAHAAFAYHTHQYIRDYIQLADQKAAFVFAASTALLAFLHKADVSAHWLRSPANWSLEGVLAFVSMSGLALTSLLAAATVFPRLNGGRPGPFFFEAVAAHGTSRDYAAAMGSAAPPELTAALFAHCHDLAHVCRTKYRALKRAFVVGAVAMAATLLCLLGH